MKTQQILIIIMILLLTGCSYFNKPITSSSGNELSNNFKSVNLMLESSKEFYDFSLGIAGAAYKSGYISEKQKLEIINQAKIYKSLHNKAVVATINWYESIDSCVEECDSIKVKREIAIEFLFNMVDEGKELLTLIEKYGGENKETLKLAIPSFFDLVNALKPLMIKGDKNG